MLGRKRVENGNVNLYLYKSSVKDLSAKIHHINQKIQAICLYKKDKHKFLERYYYSDTSMYEIVKGLFYLDHDNQPCLNGIAEIKLYNDSQFLNTLKSELAQDEAAFIKEQLSWLNLEKTYSITKWLSYDGDNTNIKEFRQFVEQNVGKPMSKSEIGEFGADFKRLLPRHMAQGKTIVQTEIMV